MYALTEPDVPLAGLPDRASFSLAVRGIPAPQGSKAYKGHRTNGKGKRVPILVESSKKVDPWRDAVHNAAVAQLATRRGWKKLDGPLQAAMYFTLPAPQRMPADRQGPTTYPDLSKLLRSTEDALTTAGVWADDSRVVRYRWLEKFYPGEGQYALAQPGVALFIWPVIP